MRTGIYKQEKYGERITLLCAYCGKEYKILKSTYLKIHNDGYESKYCSTECRCLGRKSRTARVEIICEVCDKKFQMTKAEYLRRSKLNRVRFCSLECSYIGRKKDGTYIQLTCDNCGKVFKKRHDRITKRNYCCQQCAWQGSRVENPVRKDKEYMKKYMSDYYQNNKERHRELSRIWNDNNREKVLEIKRRYRINNREKIRLISQRRRAVKNDGDLTLDEWERILKLHNYKCANCGSKKNLTMDHIIPLSKGGKHCTNNVQPLCQSCNSSKHTKIKDYRNNICFEQLELLQIRRSSTC